MNDIRIRDFQQATVQKIDNVNKKPTEGFGKVIKGAIDSVNGLERDSNKSVMELLNGKKDIHETMINLQKTDISMRLLLTIRNKAVEAYKEIIHMNF
ncbi:MAG: flagellar hook-basal body complex protein FliE [Proteobacteria bacterium]|jgi:flagellar hook-basal body complex protein FliE|nr:flagellar hook-basal body complex protein FliE [Pseudomonadota bacterium]MBU1162385.1 flagellar hook-basal body complex protein FliE [Pseudomonadota bacterium]